MSARSGPLLALLAASTSACAPEAVCNGSATACDLRLDELLLPRTHNSHAAEELGYLRGASNQLSAIPTQLEDGIRSFNVDTYVQEDTLVACHGNCAWGQQDAGEIFDLFAAFLDAHPTEVIELDFQAYGHDPVLAETLEDHGLADLAYVREAGTPWPTPRALLDAGTPLLIFTAEGGDPPWLHAKNDHITVTEYEYHAVEDFDCRLINQVQGGLFEIAHHLYGPFAYPDIAATANTRQAIEDRLAMCEAEHGVRANLFGVDFYEVGTFLDTMAELAP
jgi:hypothetical protein